MRSFFNGEGRCRSLGLPGSRAGTIDPQNKCSFPLDRATPRPKKGAAARPLNCRVKIPANQPDGENTHLKPYFFSAWTLFSHRQKHLRPFAKRSILRVYLRYGQVFTCVIHPGVRSPGTRTNVDLVGIDGVSKNEISCREFLKEI